MYEWLLLAHAIGAAVLFGGHIYLESLTAAAGRANDDAGYMTVMMKASTAAERVMGAASIVTLVFGVWLVFETSYDFEDLFVTIGFAAIIVVFAVSMFLMSPRMKEISALVDENGYGDETAVSKMKSLATLVHVQTLLIAVAFVLMILKPGI
jgi:uncharacterized membrane protein